MNDLRFRLSKNNFSIYSPSLTFEDPSSHKLIQFENPTQPLVSIFTSSLDEAIATGNLLGALGEALPSSRQPFASQEEWLLWIIETAKLNSDINFLIRIHPRCGKEKRSGISSQYMLVLENLLRTYVKELPNLRICWPEDTVSSYDIMIWSQLIINGWSNICMEAGRMGIPVVNTFFDNMTSSLNPNSLFYANH